MRNATILIFVFGSVIVFYLSWLPDPDVGSNWYFPKWLGDWTNKNGNLRTAVPFLFLGLFSSYTIYRKFQSARFYLQFLLLLILIAISLIAEAGQLFLPKRHFDWADVAWATAGATSGILLSILINLVIGIRPNNS